jgi:radical S-adenosyl methionine domain-containing protein 2
MKNIYNKNFSMVVNLHLLDACDFRCTHCFSHFGTEKILSFGQWKKIIDNIRESMVVKRFNLAGGEPLLYSHLPELAVYIHSLGSEVSVISNGYSLSENMIDVLNKCNVSMIGLSIDSANPSTLNALGRHTVFGDILEPKRCIDLCKYIKAKGIILKINTVISKINYTEDFHSFIQTALPDRWKLLKMKIFSNRFFNNTHIAITDNQFDDSVTRHADIPHITERTMANNYIMIDAFGNLIDTSSDDNTLVANLLKDDFSAVFPRLCFDYVTYYERYSA